MDSSSASSKLIYKMCDEDIKKLIQLRSSNAALFDGRKNSSKTAWSAILREMGLEDRMTTDQVAKKWENLKAKYKDAKYPPSGVEKNPTCWKWFNLMDDALAEDFEEKMSQTVTTSVVVNDTPQPSKRLRQIKIGGEILEFLEEEESVLNVTRPRSVKQEKSKGKQTGTELEVMRTKFQRERELLEKELGGLDREKALLERERALAERERAALQRDRAQLEKDKAAVGRDKASLEQDRVRLEKDRQVLQRDRLALERDKMSQEFNNHLKSGAGCNGLDCPHDKSREKLILLLEKVVEKI